MTQNRNKLIKTFVGHITNAIIHDVLREAIDNPEVKLWYEKEIKNSLNQASAKRQNINPTMRPLPYRDQEDIKEKIEKRAKAILKNRQEKDYKNIDLALVEPTANKYLKETHVI
jgi:hypothetical protein